jgi:hypothetical protein
MRLRNLCAMKWAAMAGLAMAFCPDAVGNTIYTYTGNPFESEFIAGTAFDDQDFIIVSLTLSSPLPANQPLSVQIDDVVAFQIEVVNSEGMALGSSTDYTILALETNANGAITDWMVDSPEDYQVSLTYLETESYGYPVDSQDYAGMFDSGGDPVAHGYNQQERGTWTSESSAPEPSGFLLMVAGGGALALLRRRIRRGNARLEVSRA